MSQKGGSLADYFGIITKNNMTQDDYREQFHHYFKSPKKLDMGSVKWGFRKEIDEALSLEEKNLIYRTGFYHITLTDSPLMFESQIKVTCHATIYYFLGEKIEDVVKKIDLRTNRPYSKNVFAKLTTNKKQILDFAKRLYKSYNNVYMIKNIKKGYQTLPKHFFGEGNKKVVKGIYSKIYNRGFRDYNTLTRHKFLIWCDKEIKKPNNFNISQTDISDILGNLSVFYFKKKVWSDIEGQYDLITGEHIDEISIGEDTLEYLEDVDKFSKKLYREIGKLLPISGFNPIHSESELERKKKIAEVKEKMKKQAAEESKRAKEAAKKQAEKQKNRKNNKFCKNDLEFITQEDIEDIPTEDLVFIKFNGSIFCLDKDSFNNMIKYAKDQKVRGNCKPAIPGKPLECDMYYPINIGQNVYISEDNYKILEFALKKKPYEQKQYELKNKRIVDFTTGLHIMSEKSGKDAVYDLVPSTFQMEGGAYEMNGGSLVSFSKKTKKTSKKVIKKNKKNKN